MKIIIIGCGQLGTTIIKQLASENHDITVIDTDEKRLAKLSEDYDVMGVAGNGASIKILNEADISNTDILISTTASDEINLLCCLMAKKAGNCLTIARVRDPLYSGEIDFIKAHMGISMIINPEQASAVEMSQLIKYPSAIKIDSFAGDKIRLVKIRIKADSPLADTKIKDINVKTGCDILVCALEHRDNVIIPSGETEIKAGDLVSFVAPTETVKEVFEKIGLAYKPIKKVMIVGGEMISFYLANRLITAGINDIRIIEDSAERCEWLCENLPETVSVINEDTTDKRMLLEEGIENADAFVATTHIDEENIFLSMFASGVSDAKLISKVDRLAFDNIINGMDIGSVVYPHYITSDYIVRFVRARQNSSGNNVSTLCRILNDAVEALEFEVRDDSPVIGKPIMELNIKKGILICCICRDKKVIIPGGHDTIEKGDSVLIVTLDNGLRDISDILRG